MLSSSSWYLLYCNNGYDDIPTRNKTITNLDTAAALMNAGDETFPPTPRQSSYLRILVNASSPVFHSFCPPPGPFHAQTRLALYDLIPGLRSALIKAGPPAKGVCTLESQNYFCSTPMREFPSDGLIKARTRARAARQRA